VSQENFHLTQYRDCPMTGESEVRLEDALPQLTRLQKESIILKELIYIH
jgi:hypothetical protein